MASRDTSKIYNALTVDIEDWFHVWVFRNLIPFKEWDKQESRILSNVIKVLNILEEYEIKATFFILGWIAEKYPEIVIAIKEQGHEIGCHGYAHKIVYQQTKEEFSEDLDKALQIIENIIQDKVKYYRAPSFSITRDSLWALEVLSQRGILYDSSIFPIKHDVGGIPDMPRVPYYIKFKNGKKLYEFPLSTYQVWGENIPISGGGYLRLLPLWFIKKGIKQNNLQGIPSVVYFHPWELDPEQPKMKLKFLSKFRHYTNLEFTEQRIRMLFSEFAFTSLGEIAKMYKIDYQWPDFNNHYKNKVIQDNSALTKLLRLREQLKK